MKRRRKGFKDPVTGDELTLGEYVSWMIQGVIRRWAFVGIFTLVTAYIWFFADPIWRHDPTDMWNLSASYLAIFIEGVTAMAIINQAKRDAVVLRQIRDLTQQVKKMTSATLKDVEQIEDKLEEEHTA